VVSVDAKDPKKPWVKIKAGKALGKSGFTGGDQEGEDF